MQLARSNRLILLLLVSSVAAAAQQVTPPHQMKICADNGMCQILTLAGDHYDGVVVGNPKMAAKYQIRHWSADSIELYGQWIPKGTTMTMVEGPVTGKLAPSGNRVDGATFDWKMAATKQSGKTMFTFTWDAVSPSRTAAAATPAPVPPGPANVPAVGTVLPSGAVIVSGEAAQKLVVTAPFNANCGPTAKMLRFHGSEQGQMTVSAEGKVTDFRPLGTEFGFCRLGFMIHSEDWRFKPYMLNGKPTPMLVTLTVEIQNGTPSLKFK